MLVLALLRPARETMLGYRVASGLAGKIQHCNGGVDSGPLNAVISTPERHRRDHSSVVAEGSTNHGAIVPIWDHVFGTDFLPERPFDAKLGNGDPDDLTDWVGQLVAPLR